MSLGQVQSGTYICSRVDFLLLSFSSLVFLLPHHLLPPSSRAASFFLDNTAGSEFTHYSDIHAMKPLVVAIIISSPLFNKESILGAMSFFFIFFYLEHSQFPHVSVALDSTATTTTDGGPVTPTLRGSV